MTRLLRSKKNIPIKPHKQNRRRAKPFKFKRINNKPYYQSIEKVQRRLFRQKSARQRNPILSRWVQI